MVIKSIILALLAVLPIFQASAQVELVISELKVSNIKPKYSEDVINEDIENGPHVLLNAVVANRSKEDIILKPSEAIYYLMFNYADKSYLKEVFPLPFSDLDSVLLKPNQEIVFAADAPIFLGTPLLEEKKDNYTMELLKVLPTLKLILKQPDGLMVTSTSIEKVIINK